MQNEEPQVTSDFSSDSTDTTPPTDNVNQFITANTKNNSLPKKHKRRLPRVSKKVYLPVFGLILVAALGYGAYWYHLNYDRTTAKDASEVINRIKQTTANGSTSTVQGGILPPYQPSGYSFTLRPVSAQAIEFNLPSDKLGAAYQNVRRILGLEGLTGKNIPGGRTGIATDMYYENTNVHCSVTTLQPTHDWKLSLACATNSAYTAAAEQIKQYYDLFVANNPDITGDITIDAVTTQNSKSDGYKTAEAGISYNNGTEGVPASYYQTPDGTWHYFRASPVEPYCKDFTTADLKKAYLDQACYDDSKSTSATVVL